MAFISGLGLEYLERGVFEKSKQKVFSCDEVFDLCGCLVGVDLVHFAPRINLVSVVNVAS